MTPRAAQLARRRIARKTGTSMLFRLGLCSESRREEGTPHHVAANPTPMTHDEGIASNGMRILPAEAASGRPGTAGTQE